MKTSPLQKLLDEFGMTQASMARHAEVSASTMARIAKHGQWTTSSEINARIQRVIKQILNDEGVASSTIARAMSWQAAPKTPSKQKAQSANSEPSATATKNVAIYSQPLKEETDMLLRKHTLKPEAIAAFGLQRDPFVDDLRSAADVVNHKGFRLALTQMRAIAKHGGIMALIGESGSGKSTARRMLLDELDGKSSVVVIEPWVLAMEQNDIQGKTLKASHIAEAIVAKLDPTVRPKRSPQARFTQLHAMLQESHRSGRKHVLVIEEAHALPTATLKHLKRFYELEAGFTPLLSIILIGQTELRHRLKEGDSEVREVVSRCQSVELAALGESLREYIGFKFDRVGAKTDAILDKGALEALVKRLTITTQRGTAKLSFGAEAGVSKVYPLAVHNLLAAAMNAAEEMGAPKVTAQIVEGAGL